jgi:hypothetical protein
MLAALACAFPTDESRGVFVTIDAPTGVLVRGDSIVLVAHAWQRDADGRQLPLEAVSFHWFSPESSVVAVHDRHDRSAVVFGLNTGTADVFAAPLDYQSAEAGLLALRVTNTVEIDSVVPDTVRYGQQLTLYGTGLGLISRVLLGGAKLVPDTASFVGDSLGTGRERFWVPYPASSDQAIAIAQEGFSSPAADSTFVIPRDVYDSPDGGAPPEIRLDSSPGPESPVLFSNPALASIGASTRTLHFIREDTARALTFVVTSYAADQLPFVAVLSSQPWSLIQPGPASWASGIEHQFCKTVQVTTPEVAQSFLPFTSVQALAAAPGRDIYLNVFETQNVAGRFGIQVLDGYRTTDPLIPADRFEENDECVSADARFADPATRIDAFPFADTLTLDTPFDVDWIRFKVPVEGSDTAPRVVTIRTRARPFGAADSSDLDLALYRVSDMVLGFDEVTSLSSSDQPGSSEALVSELSPGEEYYLLVLDGAGVATRYSLCIGEGVTCTLPAVEVQKGSR